MVGINPQTLDGPCENGSAIGGSCDTEFSQDNHGIPGEQEDGVKNAAYERIQQNAQKIKSHASGVADMLQELLTNVNDYHQLEELSGKKDFSASFESVRSRAERVKKKPLELQDKEFQVQNSLLTELFQVSHFQSIYHIFVAGLVLLFMQSALYDILETGWIQLNFGMIIYAFGQIHTVIIVWLVMKGSVLFLFFPAFHFWANNRNNYHKHIAVVDAAFTVCLVSYFFFFMCLPVKVILGDVMPPASSAILVCEQVRLAMKTYAFVRENWARAKNFKPHQDGDDRTNSPCPDFGKFLYFSFAPTLVYRDEYPRTKEIRWNFVASNFLQVVACLFYTYYLFERFCVPVFRKFGKETFGYQSILLSVFGCMMPGTLVLLIQFFAVLHCWLNAFAEMLRFGDRLFYKDWWNSKSYANYYRTWNVVVHDWLYSYIYKDVYEIFKPRRQIPMLSVFLLSAVVHEYMVSIMFHFFYPILFLFFGGFGVLFFFLTKSRKGRFWNIFFWATYLAGPGMLMTLYCLEIYARQNCSPITNSLDTYHASLQYSGDPQ